MQTLGDIVQIGLIVLGVYAFGRVLWRAWIRPLFASGTHPESIHRQDSLPHARWSLRGELARLFLVQDDAVMSNRENDGERTSYEPTEPLPVLADTHQASSDELQEIEPEREPFSLRQLPRRDLIVLLAVQRKEDGGYLFSANQITSFVGGTAAPVKELIADVRSGKQEELKQTNRLERPQNGWPSVSKN